MIGRLKTAVLYCFACLAVAFALAGTANASQGPGGGDDDRDTSDADSSHDSDGGEGGGADDGGEGGSMDDGGEGGSSDGGVDGGSDGGESGSDGGEGGDSGSDGSGSGGEGSGSSSGHGSSGDGGEGKSGSGSSGSAQSGRGADDDDLVSVSRNDAGERVREGEAMVLTSRSDFAGRLASKGFRLVESFRVEAIGASAMRVSVPKGMSERDAFKALQTLDPKGIVTFNHIYTPAAGAAPAVPPPLAPAGSANKPVHAKVGLVDAGVDTKHPLLKQVEVTARSFDVSAGVLPDAHGTAVASLLAEAAPGATVFAANVFTRSSDGREIATADAIVRGLDWLAGLKVAVINLSLTGPANPILEAMIGRLTKSGHVLVAAVGNEGPRGAPQFPAAYDKVVGVTAVDENDRVYLYANHGDYVDFAAPGVDLDVADPKGSIDRVSGTSYAAPRVAARLAVLLDVPDVKRADAAVKELAAHARDLGAPGRDPVFGYGLIGD
jgi:hypothetical protein